MSAPGTLAFWSGVTDPHDPGRVSGIGAVNLF